MKITGRWTELRAPTGSDHAWLYDVATAPVISTSWRLGGTTPSPASFQRLVSDNVYSQFVIWGRAADERLGLIQLFNADWPNGTAELSVFVRDDHWSMGWPLEAVVLGLDHAFTELGLRKIYVEATSATIERFGSAADNWLQTEVVLADCFVADGQPVDLVTMSIDAAVWDHDMVCHLFRRTGQPTPV